MTRPVWVRDVAAVTPFGTWEETVPALAAGRSAVAEIAVFDATDFPCRVAACVEDRAEDRRLALAMRAVGRLDRAGLRGVAEEKLGVFVGAESGRASFATVLDLARAAGGGATFDHQGFGRLGRAHAARIDASVLSPATVASAIAREIGAAGPAQTFSLACASGSAAIAEAVRAIRRGVCDAAIAGGVGADVDPFMLAGFGLLGALSARGVSCPFDVRRDGFVVGEGAAFVVLAAAREGSSVRVAGIGRSLDAHHLTAPDPDGNGAERAMRAALADAGIARVGYVQAHGTSTPLNDAVEAAAIVRVLGDRARVSSVKGALGHWIAGAGAIGFLCAHAAVRDGVMLPTAGLASPDERCALAHVLGEAQRGDVAAALVNSFAFGGANVSLVLERA